MSTKEPNQAPLFVEKARDKTLDIWISLYSYGSMQSKVIPPDESLMQAVRMGNRDALAVLFKRHYQNIIRFNYKCTSDYDTALELAQDVFVKVFQNSASYQPSQRFKPWLYRIARNKCIDHIRRQYQEKTFIKDYIQNTSKVIEETGQNPLINIVHMEFIKSAEKWMQTLDGREKRILQMRLEGKDFKTISVVLKQPVSTLRDCISKALNRLRSLKKK
ncbi:RNA polymerase sigma factor [Planctomycetota bacterium]